MLHTLKSLHRNVTHTKKLYIKMSHTKSLHQNVTHTKKSTSKKKSRSYYNKTRKFLLESFKDAKKKRAAETAL